MKKGILGTDQVAQVGILVNDIEKTSQMYADLLGVEKPPIIITNPYEEALTTLNGEPTMARCKLAFFQVGPSLEIELLEPDHEPSTWRHDLDANGEGFHHLAFNVKNMPEKIAALENDNIPLVQKAEFGGGRYAYMDANSDLKILLELLERDE